jgi:DNA invertase Pin-like site-specific DNA recombinase
MSIIQPRCGIYLRTSTKDGRQDLDTQRIPLTKYCSDRGWQIAGEWHDLETGSREDRKGLMDLMDSARKRKLDIVLVFRFDRFARSTKQLLAALDEFKNLGIDFCSYSENVDTTSPAGKVMFTMISAFAEFEKSIIISRISAGLSKAKAKGIKLGRKPIDPMLKQRIAHLRTQGLSLRQIMKQTGVSIATASRMSKEVLQNPL